MRLHRILSLRDYTGHVHQGGHPWRPLNDSAYRMKEGTNCKMLPAQGRNLDLVGEEGLWFTTQRQGSLK